MDLRASKGPTDTISYDCGRYAEVVGVRERAVHRRRSGGERALQSEAAAAAAFVLGTPAAGSLCRCLVAVERPVKKGARGGALGW